MSGGRRTRPTAARVREAIFDMLAARGLGAGGQVLDCFAGSGALGIEALSRGASRAVFVEQRPEVARTLRTNLERLGLARAAEVLVRPVLPALRLLARRRRRFAGAFLDPPYGRGWLGPALALLVEGALVEPGGWVVAHHRAGENFPVPAELVCEVERRYGAAVVVLLRVAGLASQPEEARGLL